MYVTMIHGRAIETAGGGNIDQGDGLKPGLPCFPLDWN